MPHIYTELEETMQSILRPIIIGVVEQIKETCGIDKSVKVLFAGDSESIATPGSVVDGDQEKTALFATDRRISIVATEDYEQEDLGSTRTDINASTLIFHDTIRDIVLTPIYSKANVTIAFEYRTHSKTEALRWRDNIRLKISKLSMLNILNLEYHFLIPLYFLEVLAEINVLKEAQAGIDETFEGYLKRCATTRLTMITDGGAKDYRYGVKERQSRVIGIYDIQAMPDKPERDDGQGIWRINFSYKFSYDKPAHMTMRYPISINNQLLPEKYTDFVLNYPDWYREENNVKAIRDGLFEFENTPLQNTFYNPNYTLRIPEFDLFVPRHKLSGVITVMSVLVELDIADTTQLFNLSDLGDYEIDSDVLAFIKAYEYPYITQAYKSVLHLSLYENDRLQPAGILECDTNGVLTSRLELDIKKEYRVQLQVVTDLALLMPGAFERLLPHTAATSKILQTMDAGLHQLVITGTKYSYADINRSEMNLIYWLMTGKSLYFSPTIRGTNTPLDYATFIVNNTRITPSFATALVSSVSLLMGTTGSLTQALSAANFATAVPPGSNVIVPMTPNELADTYGLFTPQFLLNVRNALRLRPTVLITNVIARLLPK